MTKAIAATEVPYTLIVCLDWVSAVVCDDCSDQESLDDQGHFLILSLIHLKGPSDIYKLADLFINNRIYHIK